MNNWFGRKILISLLTLGCLATFGCKPAPKDLEGKAIPITLQTDWFAQPEHGGFYQALAKGYYAEEGLDVTIRSGGPNAMSMQGILRGRTEFAMNRADFILKQAAEGVAIQMVMATLQHDPQAILLRATNPISSIEELDGKRVMAIPGLTWITYVERKFGIRLNILPHDFGLERFLQDPQFIQQCMVTNEPFYVQQHGVEAKTIPLRDTGFDPYHGIYCLEKFAAENPDVVARFVHASIRGWKDFAEGDPTPAFDLIAQRNPRMTREFMEFSHRTLVDQGFIQGMDSGNTTGQLHPDRMKALEEELLDLNMIESLPKIQWWTREFVDISNIQSPISNSHRRMH